MLLILLGVYFLSKGLIFQFGLNRAYTDLNTTTGTLVAYEKNSNAALFTPLVAFKYAGELFFFRNKYLWNSVTPSIGTKHTVYYSYPQTKQNPNPPFKASLYFSSHEYKKSWLYIALGLCLFWLFGVQNNFSIIFGIAIAALIYFLRRPKNDININSFRELSPEEEFPNRPLSLVFDEATFDSLPKLELSKLESLRQEWLSKQNSKAWIMLAVAALCLFLTDFSKIEVPEKEPVAQKPLTAKDILDAGSLEAATDAQKQEGDSICLLFESSSCVYGYMAYDEKYTSLTTQRFIQLIFLNTGIFLIGLALFFLNSKKLFLSQDTPYSLIKAEHDRDKKTFTAIK